MRRQTTACLIAFTLVALVVTGCASPEQKPDPSVRDAQRLQQTVGTFHRDMRWGRWESASVYLVPEKRQAFLGRYEELGDDFHIVELELKSVKRDGDGRAIVELEQQSYREPSMTVKKERLIEVWDKRGLGWVLLDRLDKDEWRDQQKAKKAAARPKAADASEAPDNDVESVAEEVEDAKNDIKTHE